MVRRPTIFGHSQKIAWCLCGGISRPETQKSTCVVKIGYGYDHGGREPRRAPGKTFLRASRLSILSALASILGGLGVATPRFWEGSCGRVIKYYYILSCTGSRPIFEGGDF